MSGAKPNRRVILRKKSGNGNLRLVDFIQMGHVATERSESLHLRLLGRDRERVKRIARMENLPVSHVLEIATLFFIESYEREFPEAQELPEAAA